MSNNLDPVIFTRVVGGVQIKVRESHMRRARAVAQEIHLAARGAKIVMRGGRRAVVQPGVRMFGYLD